MNDDLLEMLLISILLTFLFRIRLVFLLRRLASVYRFLLVFPLFPLVFRFVSKEQRNSFCLSSVSSLLDVKEMPLRETKHQYVEAHKEWVIIGGIRINAYTYPVIRHCCHLMMCLLPISQINAGYGKICCLYQSTAVTFHPFCCWVRFSFVYTIICQLTHKTHWRLNRISRHSSTILFFKVFILFRNLFSCGWVCAFKPGFSNLG